MPNVYTKPFDGPRFSETFIGIVKDNKDAQTSGRLRVWIPELKSSPNDEAGWVLVNYCSPFAGASDPEANRNQNMFDFNNTQTSYGMWFVPPDLNNEVLVVFASRRMDRGFWIGCVFNRHMNHMVPGIAKGKAYKTDSTGIEDIPLPVAEYNKYEKIPKMNDLIRPQATSRVQGIADQGLIKDDIRGVNTSSAKRESPSQVYGISTPGPLNTEVDPKQKRNRMGGSSFIMDDGEGTEFVGFRTRSGASVRLDETNGIVYFINKKGTGWIQMDEDGNVDIFAAKSVSMRSQESINMRADKDINIEAGQNIYIKAAKDTIEEADTTTDPESKRYKIVGEGEGEGGNIFIQSLGDEQHTVKGNVFFTVTEGNLDIDIQKGYKKEHVAGEVEELYDSSMKTTVTSNIDNKAGGYVHNESKNDTTVNATNVVLDTAGNLKVTGSIQSGANIKSGGNVIANNGQDLEGLKDHVHDKGTYKDAEDRPLNSGDSGKFSSSGGTTSQTPVNAEIATTSTPAEVKPMDTRTNVLSTFADAPKNFERETEEVKTTVDRLMTFEPCPEHKNKGGQE